MSRKTLDIAILEPSKIIHEGLSSMILKTFPYSRIISVYDNSEIVKLSTHSSIDLFIINPSQFINKEKELNSLRKSLGIKSFIALVYSYFDQTTISKFDKVINITDSCEHICSMIDKLTSSDEGEVEAEHGSLSEREIEVLKLIIKGFSNKEIAEKLFISIHTVISHRKNISQKTGIKSQSGLTIYAISNKIVQLEDFTS